MSKTVAVICTFEVETTTCLHYLQCAITSVGVIVGFTASHVVDVFAVVVTAVDCVVLDVVVAVVTVAVVDAVVLHDVAAVAAVAMAD